MADTLQPLWDFFGVVFSNTLYTLAFASIVALIPLLYFYARFRRARRNQKWGETGFGSSIGPHKR